MIVKPFNPPKRIIHIHVRIRRRFFWRLKAALCLMRLVAWIAPITVHYGEDQSPEQEDAEGAEKSGG